MEVLFVVSKATFAKRKCAAQEMSLTSSNDIKVFFKNEWSNHFKLPISYSIMAFSIFFHCGKFFFFHKKRWRCLEFVRSCRKYLSIKSFKTWNRAYLANDINKFAVQLFLRRCCCRCCCYCYCCKNSHNNRNNELILYAIHCTTFWDYRERNLCLKSQHVYCNKGVHTAHKYVNTHMRALAEINAF